MRAAWLLDQGSRARKEISMAKVVVADALHRAVDTSLQLLGARGYSKDEPVEWIYRYARQARDRKSTRLNSSHANISYAVFCLKKKNRVPLSPITPLLSSHFPV